MSDRELDQVLVERVQQGDKRAFDLLVLKYQHKLANLVTRYLKDPNDALDVTQEAFIKAYRALPEFRGESAFYTWLYRIAINTAMNHVVAMGRRAPIHDVDAEIAEQMDMGGRLREYDTPEGHLMKEEIARTVRDAVASLPEDLRMAITLREMDGMSYDEIAKAMGCPIGTVRSRIWRARAVINERLEPLLKS